MADPLLHDAEFQAWKQLPGGSYDAVELWSGVGAHDLDRKFSRLADLYRAADPARREALRASFAGQHEALESMWLYVRRIAMLLQAATDVAWLQRGLAVAAIEGGRIDFRDTIVSLVVLRYAAERAGIDPRPHYDEAIGLAAADAVGIFTNARDHADSDVRYTVAAFGPPEWAAEVGEEETE